MMFFCANSNAKTILKSSVITYSEAEIKYLNDILIPFVKVQKQSIHQFVINHKIMCFEKEVYHLIDLSVFEVKTINLPRNGCWN